MDCEAVTDLVRTLNFFSPQSVRALWANLTSLHPLGAQKATPSSCNEQPRIEHNFPFRLYSGTQRTSTILGHKTLPDIQNDFPRPPHADLQPLRCPQRRPIRLLRPNVRWPAAPATTPAAAERAE